MSLLSRTLRSSLRPALTALTATLVLAPSLGSANDFCPDVWHTGKFGPLNQRPAFLGIEDLKMGTFGEIPTLVFSSFFNSIKNPDGNGVVGYFERDHIGLIRGINYRYPAWFDKDRDVEMITDLGKADFLPGSPSGPDRQIWPNDVQKVPNGVLPFEALTSPQGFHPAAEPGRLSIINLDDPNYQEYIVDQSLQAGGPCVLQSNPTFNPNNKPHFYHNVVWYDMNGDGLDDLVTVRSGFRVSGVFCVPASGETVYFINPGAAIDPNTEWTEVVIAGFPNNEFSGDITVAMADLEGDGVPELVTNRFFGPTPFFSGENIQLIGAQPGETWALMDAVTNPPREAVISTDSSQGRPFGVKFIDLNLDGKLEVLATNHQSDGCFPQTQDLIPGRVYALQQPASGDIFNDPWTVRILKDNIRPNPTFPTPSSGPGRLAPGKAQGFWPSAFAEATERPWVLVGGDEASKVWLLKPQSQNPNDWNYDSTTIFDIKDYYGPNATLTLNAPPPDIGNSISTIGSPVWHYDRDWAWNSYAEIYIPVFEGRDIH
ncbi:MAG: hypothetical protein KJO35_06285, partial [Gammaproteobacteria bacterium]|nr:hypothetical protein [Gammaproteobacteria bacterium]